MIPVRKNNMSVRVRAKDASYVYGSGSINDVGNPKMQSTAGQTSMLWERKRLTQEKIELYREQKLQLQIS